MAAAVLAGRRAWATVDPGAIDESWAATSPAFGAVLTRLQGEAAVDGARAVPLALAEQGVEVEPEYTVKPRAVGGFAGAGYEPVDVFQSAPIVTKARIAQGFPVADALVAGGAILSGITQTAMADAGRQGGALAIHSRPKVGYVRMLNPPSCMRCAVLAGKPSRREPFLRHPRCDCRAIPGIEGGYNDLTINSGEYFESLSPDEQARIFTKAGAQAIRDGADINQVVNARRGMTAVQSPGSTKWFVTNEGTNTRRGRGFQAMDRAGFTKAVSKDNVMRRALTRQRLMPETIYQLAGGDTAEAKRMLRMYGYI